MARKVRRKHYKLARWQPEDVNTLKEDFFKYVPAEEIAIKLKRSYGVVRNKIFQLKLRRSATITRVLKWAPDDLKKAVTTMAPDAWLEACYKWRDAQPKDSGIDEDAELEKLNELCIDIDKDVELTRNDRLIAKRMAGASLEAIARQHGLTRERVRQLTSPKYIIDKYERQNAGAALTLLNSEIERLVERRDHLTERVLQQLHTLWKVAPQSIKDSFLAEIGAVMKGGSDVLL
jgi:hypothetical protein